MKKENKIGWCFVAPSLLGVTIFILIPFLDVFRRSFCTGISMEWNWFDNYKVIMHNEAFLLASKNTIKFTLICIPLLLILSLFLAVVLCKVTFHQTGLKLIYLLPLAVPVASIAFLWNVLLSDTGIVNGILHYFNQSVSFLGSKAAFWVLVVSYIWKNLGYDMILWLAGLATIDKEMYEAAAIDGCKGWKQFWYLTLPNLKGAFVVISILSLVNSFKVFREAYLVSGDYPEESIYMLQHVFNNWFTALDIQKMCAGAVVVTIVCVVVILGILSLDRTRKEKVK